ncbi:ABC transporter permease [Microbacterium sediminicola]|uniref:ABC transporter permease n=1 Tax=Microbacterium sediminicola TaxID=415210 RepID=A0ABP4TY72_9MICO
MSGQNLTATMTAPFTRVVRSSTARATLRAARKSLLTALGSIITILALWWGALIVLQVPPFVGKTPLDVWNFMFVAPAAEENRSFIFEMLGETLVDSALGFCVGLGAAFLLAALFMLLKGVEQTLMPIALLLQSVPLIAIAPIIILIFGRDMVTTAVMGGIVVLFPALVTLAFGLRSASAQMVDLITVFGGSEWTMLRKVAIPSALPALFVAIRISVPGAITGAMIAEWLATGRGMGYAIVAAVGSSEMSLVWSLAATITAVSIVLYNLVAIVERTVLARVGMAPSR